MFPSAPPWLGHPCVGMGKPGPSHATHCPAPVHAMTPHQLQPTRSAPSNLELLAQGTDAGGEDHTHKALPASCAFGKLVGLI